jgi:hypothetical protein
MKTIGKKVASVMRKPGHLYYVNGSGAVIEKKMNRKGGKKGVCRCTKKK